MRLFFITVLTVCTFSQEAQFNVLLTGSYSTLPFQIRKERSGIYGIASFVPNTDGMLFCSYDAPDVYFVNRTGLIRQNDMRANAFGSVLNADVIHEEEAIEGVQKQCFHTSACDFFEKDGVLINAKNEKIALRLTGSQSFNLTIHSEGIITEKQFTTGRNIAAVDIAGIDEAGHLFIIAEYYKSEVPLAIERELRVYNINGELTATLAIPMIKGLTLIKEFSVDSSGNFYHLLTGKESYSLIRWSGLAECKGSHYSYPALFNYELHYNNEVPVSEPETGTPENVTASASRSFALRLGESYELYKYNCSTANLVPQAVRAPDGDTVKTPPRLIVGANAKVPYKWGGFNTLAQISTGLLQGKYAGDIHTAGVSSSSVGVDCSGFLSRCWQLSSHVSTSGMPSITTLYTAWDSLKPGDAVHRVGHVRMFIEKCPNGSLKVVESSGRDWGVSYWSYLPSDLVTYAPRFYNNMETVYAGKRPVLQSAKIKNPSEIMLSWTIDTLNVKGYRVYSSKDGVNWSMIQNEMVVTKQNTTIPVQNSTGHYRVSAVLNTTGFPESNWSNVLSVGNVHGVSRVLIVDGFDREIGDWRGAGNPFVYRYAKTLELSGVCFESIRHTQIKMINLPDYKAVIWMSGDQSILDSTITPSEQILLKGYLEQGGCLFISGSEIGWDLYNKGTASDKEFYTNYLKAIYVSDDAGSEIFQGISASLFDGLTGTFAQTYEVSFPDEIQAAGGSTIVMRYGNSKGAGIRYSGNFGSSLNPGRLVYLGFPLESTANDSVFNKTVKSVIQYFAVIVAVDTPGKNVPFQTNLEQNYPNPFNPSTVISYNLQESSKVKLEVFDALGRTITKLVDETQMPGEYRLLLKTADMHNPASGIYFYRLQVGQQYFSKKMILLQ